MAEQNGNNVERRREAVTNEGRFTKLETKVDRLISDAESEKETRARINSGISKDFIRVDTKIDTTLEIIKGLLERREEKIDERSEKQDKRTEEQDKRILKIENKLLWFSASAATLVAIASFVAHWLFKL